MNGYESYKIQYKTKQHNKNGDDTKKNKMARQTNTNRNEKMQCNINVDVVTAMLHCHEFVAIASTALADPLTPQPVYTFFDNNFVTYVTIWSLYKTVTKVHTKLKYVNKLR